MKKIIYITTLMIMLGGIEISYLIDPNPEFDAFVQSKKESVLRDSLIHEVDRYMTNICRKNETQTYMSGSKLVEICEQYDMDICFVMAAAQIESTFGSKGRASRTNSVFNVCAYDYITTDQMIQRGYSFAHPDDSIEPYIKLLKNDYLCGKTTDDLLNNFVNKEGHRYASCSDYERKLSITYNKIKNSNIGNLSYQLTKLRT